MVSNNSNDTIARFKSAYDLADAGFPVFPVTKDKKPVLKGGFYGGTTKHKKIAEWIKNGFERNNIAFSTGAPSGLVVIDADTPEKVEELRAKHGDPMLTTRRGAHWYFEYPGRKVTSGPVEPSLDRKADGGYAILPPSTNYTWTNGIPNLDELPPLPKEYCGLKDTPKRKEGGTVPQEVRERASEAISRRVANLPVGSRHEHLRHISGVLLSRIPSDDAEEILLHAWDAADDELARRAPTEIPNTLRTTEEALAEGHATGVPSMEDITPGLFEELAGIFGWIVSTYVPPESQKSSPTQESKAFAHTDVGNAERFAHLEGKNVRWVGQWGKFIVWNGRVWSIDRREEVSQKAQAVAQGIHRDALAEDLSTKEQQQINKWAITSQSAQRVRAMIDLAKPRVGAEFSEFDAKPWLLNCPNGTVDLKTGNLLDSNRADMLTKMTGVEYNPTATAPTFEKFLEKILPTESLRRFVQRVLGMALVGEVLEQILVIFYGAGANGKSTLVAAVLEALGEYAVAGAPDLLMAKGNTHPTELAGLFGARLVSCMESDEGRRLNEGLVKQLTGRDVISARRMREDFWDFTPTHTLFLGTNHKPEIRGSEHAIWRRLKLVPFAVTIPEDEQDKTLPSKLKEELPGILRWLVEGCLDWQKYGLQEPEAVKTATQGYRADMDTLAQFLSDMCAVHPNATVGATKLFEAYKQWCEEQNLHNPGAQRAFGTRLGERGFESFKFPSGPNKDRKGWRGVGLLSGQTPPDDRGASGQTNGFYSPPAPDLASYPSEGAGERINGNSQSGLDIQNSVACHKESGQIGPKSDINSMYQPRVEGYSENRSSLSAPSAEGSEEVGEESPGEPDQNSRTYKVFEEEVGRPPTCSEWEEIEGKLQAYKADHPEDLKDDRLAGYCIETKRRYIIEDMTLNQSGNGGE